MIGSNSSNFDDECIFCLELLNKCNSKEERYKRNNKRNLNDKCYNTLLNHTINTNIKLKCNHSYHKSCIVEWIEKNPLCPYCMKKIY